MVTKREERIRIVELLYTGLASGETEKVATLLAEDLEWWFHGPPESQHMMKILTGKVPAVEEVEFRFKPKKVVEVGKWVVAEGWEGPHAYWVHLWAVDNGVITQFREYFNTWVTVREFGQPVKAHNKAIGWKSEAHECLTRSLPELVLAI